MTWLTISAKFDSHCNNCGNKVYTGDRIKIRRISDNKWSVICLECWDSYYENFKNKTKVDEVKTIIKLLNSSINPNINPTENIKLATIQKTRTHTFLNGNYEIKETKNILPKRIELLNVLTQIAAQKNQPRCKMILDFNTIKNNPLWVI